MGDSPWIVNLSCPLTSPQVHTKVGQHGSLQAVAKGGGGAVELQERVQALLLCRALQGRAQTHGDGWNHGTKSLDEQHRHHFVRVLKDLCGADGGV